MTITQKCSRSVKTEQREEARENIARTDPATF